MRLALALVVASAPAFAQVPDAPPPPPGEPTAEPQPQPEPDAEPPRVDPAYGERPQATEPSNRVGPDDSYVSGIRRGQEIVVRFHPDRSRKNITTVAVIGGAAVLFGAVGLYFHLDSRDATAEVETNRYRGQTWTQARQDSYERAHSSARAAGVLYGIGGALALATAVTYIVTEPKLETRVIRPHENRRQASSDRGSTLRVAPTRGGALVGGAWTF
jgi:hypothetical protein